MATQDKHDAAEMHEAFRAYEAESMAAFMSSMGLTAEMMDDDEEAGEPRECSSDFKGWMAGREGAVMRLNIGCGKRRLPGYTGIDAVARDSVDIVAPADKIPLADGCADEVLAVHLCEHFFSWELPGVLAEWHRLLKSGGALVLEMPDFLKACKNIAEGVRIGKHPDQAGMWGVWGDDTLKDPYMMHKNGLWFDRLKPVVEAVGFIKVVEHPTVFHPAGRHVRDFRLEARKP